MDLAFETKLKSVKGGLGKSDMLQRSAYCTS